MSVSWLHLPAAAAKEEQNNNIIVEEEVVWVVRERADDRIRGVFLGWNKSSGGGGDDARYRLFVFCCVGSEQAVSVALKA